MRLHMTIMELYRQQQYMYDHKVHSVPDQIVSIYQSWIRPIVRGKAKAAMEFGTKLDISIDEGAMPELSIYPLALIMRASMCRSRRPVLRTSRTLFRKAAGGLDLSYP